MSNLTRWIAIGVLMAFVSLAFWNRSLSSSLETAKADKAAALQEAAALQQTVDMLNRTRQADNNAAGLTIKGMEFLHDRSTEAAISIERVPAGQCAAIEAGNATTAATALGAARAEGCTIDTPLPALSLPLVMLHEELSRSCANNNAACLDGGNQALARSAGQGDDRPATGAMGKGAAGGSGRLQGPS